MIDEIPILPQQQLPDDQLDAPVMTYHALSGNVYIISSNAWQTLFTLYRSDKYYSYLQKLCIAYSREILIKDIERKYEQDALLQLKARYPKGTRIKLIYMHGEKDMPRGLCGNVDHIDDKMQIHCTWDNGKYLALQPDKDLFETIEH